MLASRIGVLSSGSSRVDLSNLNVTVDGNNYFNAAVLFASTSDAVLENSRIIAFGSQNGAQGLQVSNSAELIVENTSIEASGGNNAIGILNNGGSLVLRHAVVSAFNGNNLTLGIRIFNGQTPAFVMDVSNSEITANSATSSFGLFNDSSFTANVVRINRSTIFGIDLAINANSAGVFNIGASQLEGGVSGGSFKCVAAYDGAYDLLSAGCN